MSGALPSELPGPTSPLPAITCPGDCCFCQVTPSGVVYLQCTRQTDEPFMMKDDEHGLPQVQPGETTQDGVTWQKQQSPGQVMAGRGDVGPGSSDGRAPDM